MNLWGNTETKTLPDDTCEQHDSRRSLVVTETVGEFRHIIVFHGAHKCSKPRSDDGSHGIGSMQICFVLAGQKGAVQWLLDTGWYTRSAAYSPDSNSFPEAWDLGYHSLTPVYEGQDSTGACDYLGGKPCYYDGTGLNAVRFTPDFLTHPGAVWEGLEEFYRSRFI